MNCYGASFISISCLISHGFPNIFPLNPPHNISRGVMTRLHWNSGNWEKRAFQLMQACVSYWQQAGCIIGWRMICAMFLSKNLLIDWRKGEQWFMQHLVDGDLAANNGGWQWCASTGTDAVPYFRVFNPISQSLKFDPNGDYIRQWVPELADLDAKTIHEPYANSRIQNLTTLCQSWS